MGLFKTSGTFTAYVHAQCGSDLNAGTREAPFATVAKAFSVSSSNTLVSGVIYETIVHSGALKKITSDSVESSIFLNPIISGNDKLYSKCNIKSLAGS